MANQPVSISDRLLRDGPKIMTSWEARAKVEVSAALHQESLALRDSLPDYLKHLASALSTKINRTDARKSSDVAEDTRLGKKHGKERASAAHYTMDQLIFEYHILRQVIFDVLEEDEVVTPDQREIIVCSIEQAVNDAATQFSETLRDVQEYLINALAHDLRNPITSAKLGAQMILRRSADAEFCKKTAGRISSSMVRLDSMIHDLLDASRLRSGQKLPIHFRPCDLKTVCEQVLEEFRYTHPQNFLFVSETPVLGEWSEHGITRVIENLVANAVKYGTPAGDVTLTLKQTDQKAKLSVHNNGPVIPAAEQTNLFEQFRRAQSAEGKPGWGIGLTVVKGITEAHGGSVSVRSDAASGTIFTVELPLTQPKQA